MSASYWFKYASVILSGKRFLGSALLSTKPWHPYFDTRVEVASRIPKWVKLPSLPLEFWSNKLIGELGNLLGKTILMDLAYKTSPIKSIARVLVEIDVRERLVDYVCYLPDLHIKW